MLVRGTRHKGNDRGGYVERGEAERKRDSHPESENTKWIPSTAECILTGKSHVILLFPGRKRREITNASEKAEAHSKPLISSVVKTRMRWWKLRGGGGHPPEICGCLFCFILHSPTLHLNIRLCQRTQSFHHLKPQWQDYLIVIESWIKSMKNSVICPFNDERAIEFSLMSHIGIIWNSYTPCYERVKQVLALNGGLGNFH